MAYIITNNFSAFFEKSFAPISTKHDKIKICPNEKYKVIRLIKGEINPNKVKTTSLAKIK